VTDENLFNECEQLRVVEQVRAFGAASGKSGRSAPAILAHS
jgi:hypothetical protein